MFSAPPRPLLIIIDGNALMHRSFHGFHRGFIPQWQGQPVSMVYGFASTLITLLRTYGPDCHFLITFDTPIPTFRHRADEGYKAQRSSAPDDFYIQIPLLRDFLNTTQLPHYRLDGYESDDLIATAATQFADTHHIIIASSDHDLHQLITPTTACLPLTRDLSAQALLFPPDIHTKLSLSPSQVIDLKALTGDSSDNYKGVPGIGPKTATQLLQSYHTLEGIYQNLDQIRPQLATKLTTHRTTAEHCQFLATLDRHCPLTEDFKPTMLKPEPTRNALEKFHFQSLARRLQSAYTKSEQINNNDQNKYSKKDEPENQMSLF